MEVEANNRSCPSQPDVLELQPSTCYVLCNYVLVSEVAKHWPLKVRLTSSSDAKIDDKHGMTGRDGDVDRLANQICLSKKNPRFPILQEKDLRVSFPSPTPHLTTSQPGRFDRDNTPFSPPTYRCHRLFESNYLPPSMSHESVWNSRPRGYGKGARSWYVMDTS